MVPEIRLIRKYIICRRKGNLLLTNMVYLFNLNIYSLKVKRAPKNVKN